MFNLDPSFRIKTRKEGEIKRRKKGEKALKIEGEGKEREERLTRGEKEGARKMCERQEKKSRHDRLQSCRIKRESKNR